MKKYSVTLVASLVLFFAIFSSGLAIGMEKELPELEPQFMGDDVENLSFLPPDVRKIIANKTLRLILDEAESNPEMLMAPSTEQKSWSQSLASYISSSFVVEHPKTPVIDFIIFLIENGANPNLRSYKGNTVLHLLITGLIKSTKKYQPTYKFKLSTNQAYLQYIDSLALKIKILARHGINLNEYDGNGFTIAISLIALAFQKGDLLQTIQRSLLILLKDLGLNFNDSGPFRSACEIGEYYIDKGRLGKEYQGQLDKLCLPKK